MVRVMRGGVLVAYVGAALGGGAFALAQCSFGWNGGFSAPGSDGEVRALLAFDDGSGRRLFAGGGFRVAGQALALGVAAWDGMSWSALASGPATGPVHSLCAFDDGTGPALYVGTYRLERWQGGSWSALPAWGDVFALAIYNDGTGAALFLGGSFDEVGDINARCIAKWNGVAWSALGSGMMEPGYEPSIYALCVYDDGTGSGLYAGGNFTEAGGVEAYGIAKWDGSNWSEVDGGVNYIVHALTVWQDEAGPALYVGGEFDAANLGTIPAGGIARWDGQAWSAVGAGTVPTVYALHGFDDGTGPALYAGGDFSDFGNVGARQLAKWDGARWTAVGAGFGGTPLAAPVVYALGELDDGRGRALYVGGSFGSAGGTVATGIARCDGAEFAPLSAGNGLNWAARSLVVHDDGTGPAVYAAGAFTTAGTANVAHVARWDGTGWAPLGSAAAGAVNGLLSGRGPGDGASVLYGGGYFAFGGPKGPCVARWDGRDWQRLGGEFGGAAQPIALALFDDGRGVALYVGGYFTSAGGVAAANIAKWDGQAWSALGPGLTNDGIAHVFDLAAFDDGRGAALYAVGTFTKAGGVPASAIARWDGVQWSGVGGGLTAPGSSTSASALAVYDDGRGAALYAGGTFPYAGGLPARGLARWDGSSWSALPAGVVRGVGALCVFNDGGGTALYVGGGFETSSGLPASGVARWDGAMWSAVGEIDNGVAGNGFVYRMVGLNEAGGPALYVGGNFVTAGGNVSAYIAKWSRQCPAGDMNCDGVVSVQDVEPFVVLLFDWQGYANQYPACNALNGDFTADGVVNNQDIDGFVAALFGG